MKISALVVTFNEETRLRECLKSISFCNQLVVVDIGSSDNSVNIATEFTTDLRHHKFIPIVEEIWPEVIPTLSYDWILRADPDEIFPEGLIDKVGETISSDISNIGIVTIPYQYYFLGKPLKNTIWGGVRTSPKIIHRQRINLNTLVHKGIEAKEGFITLNLIPDEQNVVKHYWVDSYKQLFLKHFRYIKYEGKSRYETGERFLLFSCIEKTIAAIRISLFDCKGWRGGFVGIFLSLFFGWYIFNSLISLGLYQWQMNNEEK
jgi:glycosyltransferase involved in cell wall biosynthesis